MARAIPSSLVWFFVRPFARAVPSRRLNLAPQLFNMPKRTRTGTDTDTDTSEFPEASDGSYCETSKPRSKKTRQTRQNASKRARTQLEGDSQGVAPSTSTQATHPTSWHVVTGVDPIRESLLDWYGRKREARGMPWRKPFDESLDKDGRAQRAYEVRSRLDNPHSVRPADVPIGVGVRNHASADPGSDCDTVL